MNDLTHSGMVGHPVFIGFEQESSPQIPMSIGWKEQLREQLARVQNGLTDAPELQTLFVQAFTVPGTDHTQIRDELNRSLGSEQPVLAVTPVKSLPGNSLIRIEAILVPRDKRVSTGPAKAPDALRIGTYFAVRANGSVGSTTTEKITSGLSAIRSAFDDMEVSPGDVLKYNIFYQGEGTREEWEDPVRLRSSLFSGPGPCTTGIPVLRFEESQVAVQMLLFGKAIARCQNDVAAVRPANHWDWPIPLPYSHGNRVGDLIFVGGQVSLAPDSEVIDPHDLSAQVHRSMQYINNVFLELGGEITDATRLTAFFEDSHPDDLLTIRREIAAAMPDGSQFDLSLIGLDKLSYPDMRVEIEAQGTRQKS